MKKWILWTIAFLLLSTTALQAQNLTGSWQGTLNVNNTRTLRIVIKVAKDGDSLKGMFYSIDQPGPGIGTGPITVQGLNVKIPVPGIGGTYEGKLASSEGDTITGTWTQGPTPLPLNLTRATPQTALDIPAAPAPPRSMDPKANPGIEVATIKPSMPGRPGKGFTVQGTNVITINTSLSDLLSMGYEIHPKQLASLPDWAESDKYDITIKADVPGLPNTTQYKTLIQKLAAERFQLKFHREKRDLAAYVISVTKTGSKVTPSAADPNSLPGLGFQGLGRMVVRNATLAEFAQVMQGNVLDRPVVDQSGLNGRYDFTLNWTPDEFQFPGLRGPNAPPLPPPPPGGQEAPDLFTAIQQQLGLKLDSMKASVDVLVIDHSEKPSEN